MFDAAFVMLFSPTVFMRILEALTMVVICLSIRLLGISPVTGSAKPVTELGYSMAIAVS